MLDKTSLNFVILLEWDLLFLLRSNSSEYGERELKAQSVPRSKHTPSLL
jgi:hypothetical protein